MGTVRCAVSEHRILNHFYITEFITMLFFSLLCQAAFGGDLKEKQNYLKDYHEEAELSCEDCHNDTVKNETQIKVTTDVCLECHGDMEAVAQLTADIDPNPHDSPHYGPYLDCALCHHEHSLSENYCINCHEWVSIVP